MATLVFSEKWPQNMGGDKTQFASKIWCGLFENKICSEKTFEAYYKTGLEKFGYSKNPLEFISRDFCFPKVHTIREDSKNLWVPGRKIHMVYFNRSKNRFQFAPVLEVKSVQFIKIIWDKDELWGTGNKCLYLGERPDYDDCMPWYFEGYGEADMNRMARNDGFNSVEHFFQWFNNNFTGKIIHWTDLKY